MCGIFGAIAAHGWFGRDDHARFVHLTDMVRYRGPDDGGYRGFDVKGAQMPSNVRFDVFLGNRRLSIIDLSPAGHQPMTDGNGQWIAYNGEIFNFLELRRELEAKGHSFRTDCDTEVILHIYSQYGESGFAMLNGMWAFAIVDLHRRKVVLSRDRFSMKPLYLLELPGRLYFASEIKQLLPLLPVRRLNHEAMSSFLAQGLIDHGSQTLFEGIHQVRPKHNLSISFLPFRVDRTQYWDYSEEPVRAQHAVEQFRELFVDSIRIRLRSDVKVGVLLSGGLDSSSIAIITDSLASRTETYSVVSEHSEYSEEPYIDALTSAANLNNYKLTLRLRHIPEALDRALDYSDEPFTNLSPVAHYKLMETIRERSDAVVLLSGQGGDEILLGYLKFFFFFIRELIQRHHYGAALQQLLRSAVQGTAVHQFNLRDAARYMPIRNKCTAVLTSAPDVVPIGSCDTLRKRQLLDIDRFSVPALAHYEDRNAMAHSMEIRHPFLDHRLVNFTVNLPSELKLHQGWSKYILRKSIVELPPAIRWRKDKQGFTIPEERWLKHDLSGSIRQSFRKSRLADLGVAKQQELAGFYESYRNGERISSAEVARFYMAECWAQKFFPLSAG